MRQGGDESTLRSCPRNEGSSHFNEGSSLFIEGSSLFIEGSSLLNEGSSLLVSVKAIAHFADPTSSGVAIWRHPDLGERRAIYVHR